MLRYLFKAIINHKRLDRKSINIINYSFIHNYFKFLFPIFFYKEKIMLGLKSYHHRKNSLNSHMIFRKDEV